MGNLNLRNQYSIYKPDFSLIIHMDEKCIKPSVSLKKIWLVYIEMDGDYNGVAINRNL